MTAHTRVAGVVGNPVRHSLSPLMHNAAFGHLGLDWVYVAFPIVAGDATEILRATWDLGVEGLSVTMPHKQAAARAARGSDSVVEKLGVANTLVRGDAGWFAHNTDVDGFRQWAEQDLGLDIPRTTFGILGGGGVASAVATAIGDAAETVAWNRTREKAVELVGPECVLDDPAGLSACEVVVSCVPTEAVPEGLRLRKDQVLLDLAYDPEVTPLMQRARGAGAEAHNGLGLLVRQGALQFEHWTGLPAPREVMRAAVASRSPPERG